MRTKKALDFFFLKKGGYSWGKKGKKKKKLMLVLSNRQISKSEMEAVGWRKRKLYRLEAYASQCMVYYPALISVWISYAIKFFPGQEIS